MLYTEKVGKPVHQRYILRRVVRGTSIATPTSKVDATRDELDVG